MELLEELINFGLTRQESTIYLTLMSDGELTGYEVAKLTGISRSNTYTALAGIVDKGAAYAIEGNVTKYSAVNFLEFSQNFIRNLQTKQAFIIPRLPERKKESDGYLTIRGKQHITNKILNMLEKTEYRVYTSLPITVLLFIEPILKELISAGKKVVILTNQPYDLKGAVVYLTANEDCQIRLIVDSEKVLTGRIDGYEEPTCLYSKNQNLIDVFKEMLQNEITLIELKQTAN